MTFTERLNFEMNERRWLPEELVCALARAGCRVHHDTVSRWLDGRSSRAYRTHNQALTRLFGWDDEVLDASMMGTTPTARAICGEGERA